MMVFIIFKVSSVPRPGFEESQHGPCDQQAFCSRPLALPHTVTDDEGRPAIPQILPAAAVTIDRPCGCTLRYGYVHLEFFMEKRLFSLFGVSFF